MHAFHGNGGQGWRGNQRGGDRLGGDQRGGNQRGGKGNERDRDYESDTPTRDYNQWGSRGGEISDDGAVLVPRDHWVWRALSGTKAKLQEYKEKEAKVELQREAQSTVKNTLKAVFGDAISPNLKQAGQLGTAPPENTRNSCVQNL